MESAGEGMVSSVIMAKEVVLLLESAASVGDATGRVVVGFVGEKKLSIVEGREEEQAEQQTHDAKDTREWRESRQGIGDCAAAGGVGNHEKCSILLIKSRSSPVPDAASVWPWRRVLLKREPRWRW